MTTTLTALFDSYGAAIAAVRDLRTAGVPADDISLVACNSCQDYEDEVAKDAGTGATVGAGIGGAGGLLAGLGLIAIPGLGPVVAAGWLATTAVTAAGAAAGAAVGAATGGLIGALTADGIDPDRGPCLCRKHQARRHAGGGTGAESAARRGPRHARGP